MVKHESENISSVRNGEAMQTRLDIVHIKIAQ